MKKEVLFICVHNAARSQMAEAYLRQLGGDDYRVESAGFEPKAINPLVVEIMAEEGIDLSGKKTQSVFELFKQGRTFQYVITVCSEAETEGKCPIFPGLTHRLSLPFPDPAGLTGSHQEQLEQCRGIRDSIKEKMREFLAWEKSDTSRRLGQDWSELSVPGGPDQAKGE